MRYSNVGDVDSHLVFSEVFSSHVPRDSAAWVVRMSRPFKSQDEAFGALRETTDDLLKEYQRLVVQKIAEGYCLASLHQNRPFIIFERGDWVVHLVLEAELVQTGF